MALIAVDIWAIGLLDTGLPHRYSGEPEEDSQAPHWGGAEGSQEELSSGDLTQREVRLEGETGEERRGRKNIEKTGR